MDKKKKWFAGVGSAALLLLALGFFWGESIDPAVAALEAQRERMFSDQATDEERQAFRDQVGRLTEQQRRQFFQRSRPDMQRRMAERMTEVFALPPEELRNEARRIAADVVADRRDREANPDDRRGGPGRGGPPGGRPGRDASQVERDAFAKKRLDFVDPGTRGQVSEFRRMVNDELEANGQEPMSGRDMRSMMRNFRG